MGEEEQPTPSGFRVNRSHVNSVVGGMLAGMGAMLALDTRLYMHYMKEGYLLHQAVLKPKHYLPLLVSVVGMGLLLPISRLNVFDDEGPVDMDERRAKAIVYGEEALEPPGASPVTRQILMAVALVVMMCGVVLAIALAVTWKVSGQDEAKCEDSIPVPVGGELGPEGLIGLVEDPLKGWLHRWPLWTMIAVSSQVSLAGIVLKFGRRLPRTPKAAEDDDGF